MLLEPCWTARTNQQRFVTMLLLACAFPFSPPQNPWSTYIFRTCNFHMFPIDPNNPRPYRNFYAPLSGPHLRSAFSMRLSTMAVQEARAVCWRILTTVAPSCCTLRKPWWQNRWSPSLWCWDFSENSAEVYDDLEFRIPHYGWLRIHNCWFFMVLKLFFVALHWLI